MLIVGLFISSRFAIGSSAVITYHAMRSGVFDIHVWNVSASPYVVELFSETDDGQDTRTKSHLLILWI